MKYHSKHKTFHSQKCIWKCHLWNGIHFVQGEMEWFVPKQGWPYLNHGWSSSSMYFCISNPPCINTLTSKDVIQQKFALSQLFSNHYKCFSNWLVLVWFQATTQQMLTKCWLYTNVPMWIKLQIFFLPKHIENMVIRHLLKLLFHVCDIIIAFAWQIIHNDYIISLCMTNYT